MTRERTIERLDEAWRELQAAIEAVPEERLLEPGVAGGWSVRDLLAHVSSWEREFVKAVPIILAGRRLPHYSTQYGGIDAFNAGVQASARALSLAEVRDGLAASHAAVHEVLSKTPVQESRTEERMRRRLRNDTTKHYREHAGQIRAWGGGAGELRLEIGD